MDSLIFEIRAGAGGEEAALFARDLFRMYSKYAQKQNWKITVLDASYSELAGFKKIFFKIKGEGAFEKLKHEGGVHRVQRIPKTEKGNRIHTSTVSVAVLPQPEFGKVKIKANDLKIQTFRASGPGGQYVNKRATAIRITHSPTGITVSSQAFRTLEQNKKAALEILEAKLYDLEKEKIEKKISQERKSQIGRSQRAEKIRTYNFPQDRITDHRIKKSWHNIEKILAGKLDPITKSLKSKLN